MVQSFRKITDRIQIAALRNFSHVNMSTWRWSSFQTLSTVDIPGTNKVIIFIVNSWRRIPADLERWNSWSGLSTSCRTQLYRSLWVTRDLSSQRVTVVSRFPIRPQSNTSTEAGFRNLHVLLVCWWNNTRETRIDDVIAARMECDT